MRSTLYTKIKDHLFFLPIEIRGQNIHKNKCITHVTEIRNFTVHENKLSYRFSCTERDDNFVHNTVL